MVNRSLEEQVPLQRVYSASMILVCGIHSEHCLLVLEASNHPQASQLTGMATSKQ